MLRRRRWQFVTNGTDIGFSVRLKGDKVEKAPAAERVNSHLVPEEDTMQCEQPGTCESADVGHCRLVVRRRYLPVASVRTIFAVHTPSSGK